MAVESTLWNRRRRLAMRDARSETDSTPKAAVGMTTPAGTGASIKVTRPRFSGLTCGCSAACTTGVALAGSAPRDSSKGMPSSVKESSSASRAPRSGTANTIAIWSRTICRKRPSSLASEPAIPGWRTASSAVTLPPVRRMEEKHNRCWCPKSNSRGLVKRPSVFT